MVAHKMGNLPLAIHIFARRIVQTTLSQERLSHALTDEISIFEDLQYENKTLFGAIERSFKGLNPHMGLMLVSASIFKGKDFSYKSISYINGVSTGDTIQNLEQLVNLSLVERSTYGRYRLHPAIQEFVRGKLNYHSGRYLIPFSWGLYLFFTIWWVYLQVFVAPSDAQYAIFTATKGIMAFFGGICGLFIAHSWGGMKSQLGRSIYMFSTGLLFQAFGEVVWSIDATIQKIEMPYPSLADVGYFGTIPIYAYGLVLLAKASGIRLSIQSYRKKITAILVPITMLSISYILFLRTYEFDLSNPLLIFLDFGYPTAEAVNISMVINIFILSRTILDGILRSKALLLLLAVVAQFAADYVFLLTTDIYYQGNFVAMMYLTAFFSMTLALLHLRSIRVSIRE